MAQLSVHSVEWRAEGFSANIVLSHVSQLSRTEHASLLDTFPGAASTHLGIWHVIVYPRPGRPGWIQVSLSIRGVDNRYMLLAQVKVEAMQSNTWLPARIGRIFQQHGPLGLDMLGAGVDGYHYGVLARSLKNLRQAGFLQEDTLRLQLRAFIDPLQREPMTNAPLYHFGCIFDSGDFSDLTFAANGREFQVHRCILTAHSPVLRRMMCTGMSESTRRRVDVPDLDATTAEAFLRFLYSGSCSDPGLSDIGFADRCDRWYLWHSLCQCSPDQTFDLTVPLRDIMSMSWFDIRKEGNDLQVRRKSRRTEADTVLARNAGLDKWIFDADGKLEYFKWKNFAIIGKRKSDDRMYDYLFSKAWEMQYAHFWGRLLRAADKYGVDELTKLCEDRMIERLSVWSAVPMLEHACLIGRQSLKQRIMEFITLGDEFFQSVKDMPEFDSLDHELQNEIAEVFLQRLRGKRTRPASAGREFADGDDWQRLSCAQLRRACAERNLATGGNHATLVALLQAQES